MAADTEEVMTGGGMIGIKRDHTVETDMVVIDEVTGECCIGLDSPAQMSSTGVGSNH